MTISSLVHEFTAAMRAHDIEPPAEILADGRVHRFPVEGDRAGKKSGAYRLYGDDRPAGWFMSHKDARGLIKWRSAEGAHSLSAREWKVFRKELAKRDASRAVEEAQRRAAAAEQATMILDAAITKPEAHAYWIRKGIALGSKCRRGAYPPMGWDDALLVPLHLPDGKLVSVQAINPEGRKMFLPGGLTKGAFHPVGELNGALTILIGEGLATVAAASAATGLPAAAALSAGNLFAVATAVRDREPRAHIIIVADNDMMTDGNPGLRMATEAARAVRGSLAVPELDGRACDLWDVWHELGPAAAKSCIEAAKRLNLSPSLSEERRGPAPAPKTSSPAGVGAGLQSSPACRPNRSTESSPPTDWPDPQTLNRHAVSNDPYPIDALPSGIQSAVVEYQAYGQQPLELVATSGLSVVSLAAQGLADIARDDQLIGPTSLSFLVVAKSGERKTAADKAMGVALGQWERDCAEAMREQIARNRVELEAWTAELDGLKAAIKANAGKSQDKLDELRHRLIEHERLKPVELWLPRLRYEDVNPQSLAMHLACGHPSAAIWSDEGGLVTGSHGMGRDSFLNFLTVLNRLWDGGAIRQDRKSVQSVHVEGRRLTVCIMVQPAVLRELTSRSGDLARGSGFLARFLLASPQSTMGSREYRPPPSGTPHQHAFHGRIRQLLDRPLNMDSLGRLAPTVLRLSPEAFDIWRAYHNEVERKLTPLGDYEAIGDFASKSAENAARLAGCLHVVEDGAARVSGFTMHCAVRLARWYLQETLRVLDLFEEPLERADARLLDAWLARVGSKSPRDIHRNGPNQLREKGRRDAAIDALVDLGRARRVGKPSRLLIERNPLIGEENP